MPSLLHLTRERAVWMMAWPTVVQGALMSAFLLVDSFWISRLGYEALAGLTAASFALWSTHAFGEIAATGVYARVAQATGAERPEEARRVLGQGLRLAVGVGLLLGLGILGLRGVYLDGLALDGGPTRRHADAFLAACAAGTAPQVLLMTVNATFRGIGDARSPLLIMLAAVVLNAVLDPLLMFGLGGVPGLGIAGAAWATTISTTTAALLGLAQLRRRGHGPLWEGASAEALMKLARLGLPMALSGVGFNLVYVFLARILSPHGPAAMAALGLGHRVESPAYLTGVGLAVAATTLVGQHVGARDPVGARQSAYTVARLAVWVLVPMGLATALGGDLWFRPFTADPEVLAHGAEYALYNGLVQVLMGFEMVFTAAFAGAGRTLTPLLIALPGAVLRLPLAWWLSGPLGLGAEGVFAAIALSTALKGGVMALAFTRERLPQ